MRTAALLVMLAASLQAAIPIESGIFGPGKAYRGKGSTYLDVRVTVDANAAVYFYDLTGLPAGVTTQYICDNLPAMKSCWGPANGRYYQYTLTAGNYAHLFVRFTASDAVAAGTYPITLKLSTTSTSCTVDNCIDVNVSLRVIDVSAVPATPSLTPIAIPGPARTAWEGLMWSASGGGSSWVPSDPPSWTCSSANHEAYVWYYDGARNYYSVADYLGSTAAANAADIINRACVTAFTNESHGWHVFPRGLYEGWRRDGTASYKTALDGLVTNSTFGITGEAGRPERIWSAPQSCWATYDRETSYYVQALVYDEMTGAIRANNTLEGRTALEVAVDKTLFALGEEIAPANDGSEFQSWIYGVAAQSLIDYYEHTKGEAAGPDTRVLDFVKTGVDWAWSHRGPDVYGLGDGAVLNNPQPLGDLCCSGSGGCQKYILLNNPFFAQAAAWYWRKTGDDTYRVIADTLFSDAMTQIGTFDSGKQWSQAMRGAFLYYNWRNITGIASPRLGGQATVRGGAILR